MPPFGVLHIPHSATAIPAEVIPSLLVSDDVLRGELFAMTDWYTDELFALPAAEAVPVRFPISRLVLDPERFLDDSQEVMSSRGMGVIYTRTHDGQVLRDAPTAAERQALIERYYVPHHAALTQAVRLALEEHRQCLVVDCHSFSALPQPCGLDQSPDRPDICVGTDPFHTPAWLTSLAVKLFDGHRLSVEVDRPYSGALVPTDYYQHNASVAAIMVELNRRLYMDESTGEKSAGFVAVAEMTRGVVGELVDSCRVRRKGLEGLG